ncbi:MAG: 50S ribosomal protein L10 [Deltaproteobacteria bacterium]|nr:50S ribosomal protein L10 [Deltaproteobacteria bacterium]
MERHVKEQMVAELNQKFASAEAMLAVGFTRIDVDTITALRKQFRDSGVEYRVVKNTLARLAAKGTPAEEIVDHFVGPTAMVFGYDDVVAPAKIVHEFLKEKANKDKIDVRGGVVQGKRIDAAQVEALAKMPGLPELRSQLLALFNTPATTLVRLLNTPGQQIAQVIKAKTEKEEA